MTEYWNQDIVARGWTDTIGEGLATHQLIDCWAQGCLLGQPSMVLALSAEAVRQACQAQRPVIAPLFVSRSCDSPDVISDFHLGRQGPLAIWIHADGSINLQDDADRRGARPWTNRQSRSGDD